MSLSDLRYDVIMSQYRWFVLGPMTKNVQSSVLYSDDRSH